MIMLTMSTEPTGSDMATARTWLISDADAERLAAHLGTPIASTVIDNVDAVVQQAMSSMTIVHDGFT